MKQMTFNQLEFSFKTFYFSILFQTVFKLDQKVTICPYVYFQLVLLAFLILFL